jgi:DnaJ homolog subfamily A member 5
MICHYEVFNLPFSASAEDIKKKYKKLALQYHPGKEDHLITY